MNTLGLLSFVLYAFAYSTEESFSIDGVNPEVVNQDGTHMDAAADGFYYGYYNPRENKFVAVSAEPVTEQMIYANPIHDAHPHHVEPEKPHHSHHVHRHEPVYQETPVYHETHHPMHDNWADQYYHEAATAKLPHAEVIAYASPELSKQVAGPGERNVYRKGHKGDSDSDMIVVAGGKPNPMSQKDSAAAKKTKDDDKPKNKPKDQDENSVAGFMITGLLAIVALVSC